MNSMQVLFILLISGLITLFDPVASSTVELHESCSLASAPVGTECELTVKNTSRTETFTFNDEIILIRGNHKIFQKMNPAQMESLRVEEKLRSVQLTFPNVSVDIPWGLPVEVQIIASLPQGTGDWIYKMATGLQFGHPEYILAFNEASSKIMNTNFPLNDPTAVYTFSVDKEDLVFHRHEGHRCITGISGSGGTLMKFSTVDHIEAKSNARSFVDKMFVIEVPSDSIFVLRFNGMVYHQFGPKDPSIPAFFAVSAHTNERGGELTSELLEKVLSGEGNIPLLTEPITDEIDELLKDPKIVEMIPRYVLPRIEMPASVGSI